LLFFRFNSLNSVQKLDVDVALLRRWWISTPLMAYNTGSRSSVRKAALMEHTDVFY
jgi:hypothetical protein